MRSYLAVILIIATFICFGSYQQTAGAVPEKNTKKELWDIIGVTHVDDKYHLTDKDF